MTSERGRNGTKSQRERETDLLRERLQVLAGERGSDKSGMAVTRGDLARLADLGKMQAKKAAGDPPTQAEFDALVDDVQRLYGNLDLIVRALFR